MNSIAKTSALLLLTTALFASCVKTKEPPLIVDPPPSAEFGKVKLEFFNMAGSSNLSLNNEWYLNENGDSFKVTKLNYYISNVKLNGATASYTEPESYHLLRQDLPSSLSFNMDSVRIGTYTSVTFMVGVDSMRNVSGAQTGVLDPGYGMFWSWSTGYIMWKFEGNSPRSTQPNGELVFHGGGFKGAYPAMRTLTFDLPAPITVGATDNHIHLSADVLAIFKGQPPVDFSRLNTLMGPGSQLLDLSTNFSHGFSVTYAGK